MSRSQGPRASYHHGDLRTALLDAARQLAADVGVDAMTLREVARRAGVSHAAPYHHFADKAALLRALATDAFGRLAGALRAAAASRGTARAKLEAVGVAYVTFALAHPVEFRFMFRRDLCIREEDPVGVDNLRAEGASAYQVLLDSLAACQRKGQLRGHNLPLSGLTAWSTVHGLAELLLNDPMTGTRAADADPSDTARAVARVLNDGLLAPRPQRARRS